MSGNDGNRVSGAIRFDKAGIVYPNGAVGMKDLDLEIKPGEFVVIVGSSGAGKSTLLRAVNGLNALTSGSVEIDGERVSTHSARELRRMRKRIGMIFQDFRLVKRLSVMSNVLIGRLAHVSGWRAMLNLWPREDREIAIKALKRVGIADKAWVKARDLSGGQQQRVGVARALAQQPAIILADEPVASLDPVTTHQIMKDLVRINRELGSRRWSTCISWTWRANTAIASSACVSASWSTTARPSRSATRISATSTAATSPRTICWRKTREAAFCGSGLRTAIGASRGSAPGDASYGRH